MTKAIDLIAAERARQVSEEGYTAEHDTGHAGELARAAATYALAHADGGQPWDITTAEVPVVWPWAPRYWKPSGDAVRDLVKAGALIAAAIDSLTADREIGDQP